MVPKQIPLSDEIKIYAAIGVICLEWSLLEMNLLRIIGCAENAPMVKIFTSYAGLDMLPRVNMAIKLARLAKWPGPLIKRIETIRTELQGKSGRNGLADKRNQFVHGVHGPSKVPGCVSLTMARWEGPKRTQNVSAGDAHSLAVHLHRLAEEAWSIADAYGAWKFGPNINQDRSKQLTPAKSASWLKVVERVQGVIRRLFGTD